MKRSLSLLLPVIIVLCSFTGRKNNSISDDGLKGNVKSVTEYVYYSMAGKEELSGKTISEYDETGNAISRKTYDKDGNPIAKMACTLDHKYNGNGNKIEENIYNADGSLSWKTIFTYDKNGMVTETNRYHDDGALEEKVIYKNNGKSNEIEGDSYNGTGGLNGKSIQKYDEQNNLVEETNEFDMPNLEIKDTLIKEYDKKGDLIASEQIEYQGGDDKKYSHDVKNTFSAIDNTGNWVRKIAVMQIQKGHDSMIYMREISYY